MCDKKSIPKSVSKYMAKIGSKGGSATGSQKANPPDVMSRAAKKRWANERARKVKEA